MCSALLPVTAVNDQSQLVLQSCFAFADLFNVARFRRRSATGLEEPRGKAVFLVLTSGRNSSATRALPVSPETNRRHAC